jgi:hypothetical protein
MQPVFLGLQQKSKSELMLGYLSDGYWHNLGYGKTIWMQNERSYEWNKMPRM